MSQYSEIQLVHLSQKYVRFPTSKEQEGTDAMHTNCDYSAVYIEILTANVHQPSIELPNARSIIFTIGKGTETVMKCVEELSEIFMGTTLDKILGDFSGFWRRLTCDPQMRWIGPEKGVIHMAVGGIVNAIWDLWAKLEKKPLWRLLSEMDPKQLISCLDFRYVTDVLTPEEALEILTDLHKTRKERIEKLLQEGFPAYTTAVGWAGYSDEKVKEMIEKSVKAGFKAFKAKVGCGSEKDLHRLSLIRELIGKESILMTDANQVWSVSDAISCMKSLAHLNIYWIEEPTAPDDAVGHSEIAKALNPLGIRVATGEHAHNRILHKQMNVLNSYQVVQSDPVRVAGLNELIIICLMAKKFNKPVCLHAGGVGLCEMGVHMAAFDYIGIGGSLEGRFFEYSGALHEHFIHPVRIKKGAYVLPEAEGYGVEMKEESIGTFLYPEGNYWRTELKMKNYNKFKGIMAATFAPYTVDGKSLNLSIIPVCAEALLKQNIRGIFVNGSAGESFSLTKNERMAILEKWMGTKEVKEGKLQVIAHVGCHALEETVELAKHAGTLGVKGVAIMAPSFFKPKKIEELVSLIVDVASQIPETPFYYYHYPAMNSVQFDVIFSKLIFKNIV